MTISVIRLPIRLEPDSSRVITRFFGAGEEKRIRAIMEARPGYPNIGFVQITITRKYIDQAGDSLIHASQQMLKVANKMTGFVEKKSSD